MIYVWIEGKWKDYLINFSPILPHSTSPDAFFSPFVQEEIMEWWSTTSEAGVEIPSEEDLLAKLQKKKMLGL